MLNPIEFLKPSRLFLMQPSRLSSSGLTMLIVVFGLALIGAGVFWWLRKNKKQDKFLDKFYRRMFACLLSAGIVGFILLALRQGQIYFFGARFWFLVWFLSFGAWAGHSVYYLKKIVPKRREAKEAEELFGKYLPKKKK